MLEEHLRSRIPNSNIEGGMRTSAPSSADGNTRCAGASCASSSGCTNTCAREQAAGPLGIGVIGVAANTVALWGRRRQRRQDVTATLTSSGDDDKHPSHVLRAIAYPPRALCIMLTNALDDAREHLKSRL
jgi:hypothetical protein